MAQLPKPLTRPADRSHGPAAARLDGLLDRHATGKAETGVAAQFVPQPFLGLPEPMLVTGLLGQLDVACGTPQVFVTHAEGDLRASSVVTGPNGSAQLRCRVEAEQPHRIEWLDLVPAVQGEGAREWASLGAVPVRHGVQEVALETRIALLRWLTELRERTQMAGVCAAVVVGGELVWSAGLGWADIEQDVPMDPAHGLFRIGSISKTMTTATVLQLVEAGRVELDGPANDYLRTVRLVGDHAYDVSVRHLLTHTSGVRELEESTFIAPFDEAEPTVADFLGSTVEVVRVPGAGWAYSNVGMTLAGQLIDDVTGNRFEDLAAQQVFAPLGMTATGFLEPQGTGRTVPTGYREGFGGLVVQPRIHCGAHAAGSVFSTPEDMSRWVAEISAGYRGGNSRVLPAELWQQATSAQAAIPELDMAMGLGLLKSRVGEVDLLWHNGAMPGAAAQLWIAPDTATAVMLFTNVYSDHRFLVAERACGELVGRLVTNRL